MSKTRPVPHARHSCWLPRTALGRCASLERGGDGAKRVTPVAHRQEPPPAVLARKDKREAGMRRRPGWRKNTKIRYVAQPLPNERCHTRLAPEIRKRSLEPHILAHVAWKSPRPSLLGPVSLHVADDDGRAVLVQHTPRTVLCYAKVYFTAIAPKTVRRLPRHEGVAPKTRCRAVVRETRRADRDVRRAANRAVRRCNRFGHSRTRLIFGARRQTTHGGRPEGGRNYVNYTTFPADAPSFFT